MQTIKLILFYVLAIMLSFESVYAKDENDPTQITLMTHNSFDVSKEVVVEFEKKYHAKIQFLKAGDSGAALNQAILSKNNPLADLFFGVDNTFLSRALEAGIFQPYDTPLLDQIPDNLKLDMENRLLPVDYGDVCLNYDRKWFKAKGLAPPNSLADLIKPDYKGLLVVENPATSSPGLAFLLTTIGRFGKDKYLDFWKKLKANDVMVVDSWESAYWGQFSASEKGPRPLVVSYASSPAAEVYFAKSPLFQAPTVAITTPGTAFRQIEFVGILKGTKHRQLAEKLVDFMLSRPFQEDIPLQMFVFPANQTARLPEIFVKHTKIVQNPVEVSSVEIDLNRERWIEAWTQTVLR